MVTRYFTDGEGRHLVCYPFSVPALHEMARSLGIKRCWFHAGRLPHYDVPLRAIGRLPSSVETINTREIVAIVRGGKP